MKYNWPHIKHIDEIKPAIEGRDEFSIVETDWGHVINYQVNFIDTFPMVNTRNEEVNRNYALRRECRGIKFGCDGNIIARPFHKYFNINERPETADHQIDWSMKFHILEKLDGSMIHPIKVDGQILWCSKMGVTEVAKQVINFVKLNDNYNQFASHVIDNGFTPLFEWCSRSQRIIIDYPTDTLVLLAIRNMNTGEYITYECLQDAAKPYGIPVVKSFEGTFENIQDFLADVQAREHEEGYVLRFENGHAVKAKNLWYCQLHKTKELLTFEKDVWALVIKNDYDDAKTFMDDAGVDRIDRFADALNIGIKKVAEDLYWYATAARDNIGASQKKFAEYVLANHPGVSDLIFRIDTGSDPEEVVRKKIANNLSSRTKLETVRHLANNVKWDDF